MWSFGCSAGGSGDRLLDAASWAACWTAWEGVGFRTGFFPGIPPVGTGRFLDMIDAKLPSDWIPDVSTLSERLRGVLDLVPDSEGVLLVLLVTALDRLGGRL